ncbi:hypothetical protein [Nonomuraea sp. SBT364]|uniref:hypothetical protein n=1 Tax=Nonomuraea sp. SBT364 TaxID=1580530 RepID=UPI00066C6E46|nr:hypothetical protein [Nonomuraea sp. SBT364]
MYDGRSYWDIEAMKDHRTFFPAHDLKRLAPHALVVAGPFGDLLPAMTIGHRQLASVPDRCWELPRGRIGAWSLPEAVVEVLVSPVTPRWTPRPVTACWGMVWRVTAQAEVSGLRMSVGHDTLPAGVTIRPDAGYGLCALDVGDRDIELTFGGWNENFLHHEATMGRLLPRRWAELLEPDPDIPFVTYSSGHRHVIWELPGLLEGERCDVHAAVSWAPRPADGAPSHHVDFVYAGDIIEQAML